MSFFRKVIVTFCLCLSQFVVANQKDWSHSLELSVTRCFKKENVKFWCEDFSSRDERKLIFSQELLIEAIDYYGKTRSYGYGKAIVGFLCKTHLNKIKRLSKKSDQVCITGDDETYIGVNETFSRWRSFETKLGKINW